MTKTELIDSLLFIGRTTNVSSSIELYKSKELAHILLDEYLETINLK